MSRARRIIIFITGMLVTLGAGAISPGAEERERSARAADVAPSRPAGTGASVSAASPAAIFERLKSLEGAWEGRSTKGWTEQSTISVIAGGSVVLMSSFDAHPGERMITTYYLDGDVLGLTHYCVAGNQPRLTATAFSEDGREVTFTFRDGTNLATRDSGHMDKVIHSFPGPDSFTSRWTWYQNGKESWMEQIEYRRLR